MNKFGVATLVALVLQLPICANSQSEEEGNWNDTEQSFHQYEDEFRQNVENLLSMAFPYMMEANGQMNVSDGCLFSFILMMISIKHLDPWVYKMLDSTAKISGGLLEGTAMALGDYDECQDVVFGDRKRTKTSNVGSYCLIEVKPSKVILDAIKKYQVIETRPDSGIASSKTFFNVLKNVKSNPNEVAFRMGLCMPSRCDVNDVQQVVNAAAGDGNYPATVKRCETKQEAILEVHHEVIIGFIGVFLIFVAVGTGLEVVLSVLQTDVSEINDGQEKKTKRGIIRCLLAFSIINNTQKLMECDEEGDALDPLRGLRIITIFLGIFVHTYALPHPLHLFRYQSPFNFLKFVDQFSFSSIANSSAGVETFFFIAGFLSIYLRWRQIKRPNICVYIFKFISLNYLRMLLAQFLVVCLFMLAPLFGSGPLFQEFVEDPLNNCKKYWWANVLFIQNFWRPYDTCLYQTWILAVMMQLFIFTSITVYAMSRWPALGLATNVSIIVIAIIMVAVVTCTSEFPATFAVYFYDYRSALTMWKYLYVQAYNHIGPYCIGMLVAYFCAEHNSIKIKTPLLVVGWCSSVGTFLSIIYGLYDYRDGHAMNRGLAVFYSAVHRPAWSLAVGWIIYACSSGNGGIVNSILSWKALIPLDRLSYLVYLIHVPVMYFHGGIQREKLYMSHFNQAMSFVSYTCFSFVIAYACFVIFQAPYTALENLIFGNGCKYGVWKVAPSSESEVNLKKPSLPEEIRVSALFSKTNLEVSVIEGDDA